MLALWIAYRGGQGVGVSVNRSRIEENLGAYYCSGKGRGRSTGGVYGAASETAAIGKLAGESRKVELLSKATVMPILYRLRF